MRGTVRHLWWVLGVALVVGGVVLAVTASTPPADLGWFAYTPLTDGPDWTMGWGDGSVLVLTRARVAGWALTGLGLLVLASWVGYRLGRRGATAPGRPVERD